MSLIDLCSSLFLESFSATSTSDTAPLRKDSSKNLSLEVSALEKNFSKTLALSASDRTFFPS